MEKPLRARLLYKFQNIVCLIYISLRYRRAQSKYGSDVGVCLVANRNFLSRAQIYMIAFDNVV